MSSFSANRLYSRLSDLRYRTKVNGENVLEELFTLCEDAIDKLDDALTAAEVQTEYNDD